MALGLEELKMIIYTRLIRSKIYLQEYIKQLPGLLISLRHKFEHPLSEIHILIQQLAPYFKFEDNLYPIPNKTEISQDLNYFDLTLNEIKTILKYLEKTRNIQIFQEIWNEDLEEKIKQIIQVLENIKNNVY